MHKTQTVEITGVQGNRAWLLNVIGVTKAGGIMLIKFQTGKFMYLVAAVVMTATIPQQSKASNMDEKCPESATTTMGQAPALIYRTDSGASVLVCGNEEAATADVIQKHRMTDFQIIARFPSGAQKTLFSSSHEKLYIVWIDPKIGLGLQEWDAGVAYFQKYITCGNASCHFSKETCSIVKKDKIYPNAVTDTRQQLRTKSDLQDVFLDNMIEELEIQTLAGDRQAYSMLFNPELTKGARGPASVSLRSSQNDVRRLWALRCFK